VAQHVEGLRRLSPGPAVVGTPEATTTPTTIPHAEGHRAARSGHASQASIQYQQPSCTLSSREAGHAVVTGFLTSWTPVLVGVSDSRVRIPAHAVRRR
jgi:hypothetical protein